ncbi:hypothetical protein ACIPLA_21505 [Pseudomonas sp. NPDC086112]|uniref:hypothetical protein n=1 Tax=unclassified Pseudomonas TaxID=196821 RepID=UPI001C455BD6|nr:hypothetical protein [Pseudomonas sp. PDM24]MBV7498086.1 hypothetical protein [Pseudomonas sp. PDM24]
MDTKKIIELGGTISFDDISHINQLADTSMIVDELKEDLFQAVFPHNQLIDIGWHPEFSEKGTFRISLIKEYDWEHPVFSEKAKSWTELNKAISNALNKLKNDNPIKASTGIYDSQYS